MKYRSAGVPVLVGAEVEVVIGEHAPQTRSTPGADTLPGMVHLRIVVPAELAEKVLDLLEATPSTSNLILLAGAARQPSGDVILCDVAREDASVVIEDLRSSGWQGGLDHARADRLPDLRRGGRAEGPRAGAPSDAVVWEEVEARTSENIELGGTFLGFMALACLIASVGSSSARRS